MMTPDQYVALLMEIADLRIRLANAETTNEQLRGELMIATAPKPRKRG